MVTAWNEIITTVTQIRHELHSHPELTWQERRTAERIRNALDAAEIPWRACAGTGTVGHLGANATGRHAALRGDIDALPVSEATQDPWRSQVSGCMHACGHDGHTAALLGAALWLKRREARLPGPVSLLFQPAEEGGHGAREMIADGALDGVDVVFGWHNWPAIPFGQAACPTGTVMAGNGTFEIELQGRGGHASQPELCRDPVLAASAITLALQQVVARRLPPQEATVISVTSIDAASAPTVIRDAVTLAGSIRIADIARRETVCALITEVATATAAAYGVEARVAHADRYQPTVNHAAPAAEMRAALERELGSNWQAESAMPIMASEDFSYYLNAVPGAFALIGGGAAQHEEPCHSPRYRFNDALLPRVIRVYADLVGLGV
ncbi:MAG: N(2)-acetyl-L-2,4-diaminobutanoate deacetylase DoeB2 [Pseudomonadales bacterium]